MKKRQTYFNRKQIQFLQARQKTKSAIWGRGTGKSTLIAGVNYMRLKHLPKGKCFFSSTTYNQILTKTLPPIESKWQEMGLKEYDRETGGHYIVGNKPPKSFAKPYSKPKRYDNVITFWNGFTIEFLSLDRPDLARGGSFDGGDVDEAALVKKDHINRVILPSIRGNRHRFSHWLHQGINFYTSIPWKPSGYWVMEYEEKAKEYPEDYFWSEANYLDNIHILGEDWVTRMQRELGYLEFMIEVENKRIQKIEGGFYPFFDEEVHCYTPRYLYSTGERGIVTQGAKDYRNKEILELSFDFSGWFNCCTVWQEDLKLSIERMINSFHVKGDEKVNDLVDHICNYYKTHKNKFIRIWGEPRGHDRQAQSDTIYNDIAKRLNKNGWDCEIAVKAGRTTNHQQRYQFMEDVLREDTTNLPKIRINEEHCKDPIIALQVTEITHDYKKNKRLERDRNYPQQHAPHYTDTVDYYLIQKHGWKVDAAGDGGPGMVLFG
jgi:hypothetical protein